MGVFLSCYITFVGFLPRVVGLDLRLTRRSNSFQICSVVCKSVDCDFQFFCFAVDEKTKIRLSSVGGLALSCRNVKPDRVWYMKMTPCVATIVPLYLTVFNTLPTKIKIIRCGFHRKQSHFRHEIGHAAEHNIQQLFYLFRGKLEHVYLNVREWTVNFRDMKHDFIRCSAVRRYCRYRWNGLYIDVFSYHLHYEDS